MDIGLPLPHLKSEWLEDGYRQHHEGGAEKADADGFLVAFVHTSRKGTKKSEKISFTHHISFISPQIHDRLSQTRAEYPRYLEFPVNRLTFALGNV